MLSAPRHRLGVPIRTYLRAIDIHKEHIDIWTAANPELTLGTFIRVHTTTGAIERITIRTNEGPEILTIREPDGYSIETGDTNDEPHD